MCGKKLWHTYCHSHEVEVAAFQLAVQLFMKEVLRMSEEDVAALLTPPNLEALAVAADNDGSGKVRAASLHGLSEHGVRDHVLAVVASTLSSACAGVGDGSHQVV
jgi:hypothetical protein